VLHRPTWFVLVASETNTNQETPMYRSMLCALALGGLAACSGTVNSNQNMNTINITVPADAKPKDKTPEPAAADRPAMGMMPMGMPSGPSQPPPMMPAAPANPMSTVNVNINIINISSDAAAIASTDCASLELQNDSGFCDDSIPTYLTYCHENMLYEFDCSTYGNAHCGYVFEGVGEVACVEASTQRISPDLLGDIDYAFKSAIPCVAADEGYAECKGTNLFFCHEGDVYTLNCALYTDDTHGPANCGIPVTDVVDCGW
jgi:hypothetical protein